MVTLKLNDQTFPSSLLGNGSYRPSVFVDGREVLPSKWSLTTAGGEVARGSATVVQFTPTQGVPHTLHVKAVNPDGFTEETVVVFNVVLAGAGGFELGVKWAKGVFSVGSVLEGTVYTASPEGQPPQSLAWTLYRNSVRVSSGTSPLISYPAVDGVYRVSITAYDSNGVLYAAETSIAVTQNYAIQSTIAPTVPDASCVLLGAVYTDAVEGAGGAASSLPYALASYAQELWLLPGTTHIQFDLDPLQNTVDDEVVARTLTGNWAINGYPGGLYNESVGYDYLPATLLPSPADLKIRLMVDAYNVHGATYAAFSFRVRVKCYRNVKPIWRYQQCAYAIHAGGAGQRDRKWALLFSQVDAEVDVDTDSNRYITGRSVVPYTTPIVTSLPGMVLSSAGSPIPVNAATGLVYTEANRIAVYEVEGYPELDAKAVAAAEDVRPFTLTLEMPGSPPLIQRIKRLGGVMGIYLGNGAVAQGAVITVRVQTSLAEVTYAYTVPASVYVNSTEDFALVGTVNIADITDFQFDHNGMVATFYVNETAVVTSGTQPQALPAWGPDYIYAGTQADLVTFDGACYVNPQPVSTYDGEAIAFIQSLTGDCSNPVCGPLAVYCYTAQCAPFDTAHFLQSYNYPSPYVAFPANPYKCYASPLFVAAGTSYVSAQGTVSLSKQRAISYPDAGLCGEGSIYAPCAGGANVLVIYPCATSPHAFVESDGACHAFVSALPTGHQIPNLNFDDFDNWTVDGRVDLIGSCPVRTLYDLVPGHGMYVDMVGSPGTGTLTSMDTWTLSVGTYHFSLDMAGNQRTTGTFSVGVSIGTHGTVFFETGSLMPFTAFDHTVVVTSPEASVELKIWQHDAAPWGGIINAGNLVDNIHVYKEGGADLLVDSFAYFQPPAFATVLSVGSVTAVSGCADILCTGSTTTGDSYVYEDAETGSRVNVYFDRLDLGVPQFAVSPTTASENTGGLSYGRTPVRFDRPRQLVMTAQGTGQLKFMLGLGGIPKKVVQVRGGLEMVRVLTVSQESAVLAVLPGDQIYIDVGTPFGGLSKRIAGRTVTVSWVPRNGLPKVYATATLAQSGSIRALGFCGLTNRQDYRVFDALPADNSTADVVNPDSVVTAQGANTAELVLIRNRSSGDVVPPLPDGLEWYAGQALAQPVVFNFYAARQVYGAHGEMDVWMQAAGTFPANLKVSDYKVLVAGTYSERVLPQVDDTTRNSLRVVASGAGLRVPRVYTATDGEQRSIYSTGTVLVLDSKTFTLNRPDPGISFTVYTP